MKVIKKVGDSEFIMMQNSHCCKERDTVCATFEK